MQGTFHFHSKYSHDGRSTLPEIASALRARDLSFCVMTEHFEDFDAAKFDRYLEELKTVSADSGLIFVPGIEVNTAGIDTILFPVTSFDAIVRFAAGGSSPEMFKVVAHPSKYDFAAVVRHLDAFDIDGIELWNQEADGSYAPPLDVFRSFASQPQQKRYRYFFGCDLHSAQLKVVNFLSLSSSCPRTPEAIAQALIAGDFVSCNRETKIDYRNGAGALDLPDWMRTLPGSTSRVTLRRRVRRCLRSLYKSLPRNAQHSLNDVKNFVRNRV